MARVRPRAMRPHHAGSRYAHTTETPWGPVSSRTSPASDSWCRILWAVVFDFAPSSLPTPRMLPFALPPVFRSRSMASAGNTVAGRPARLRGGLGGGGSSPSSLSRRDAPTVPDLAAECPSRVSGYPGQGPARRPLAGFCVRPAELPDTMRRRPSRTARRPVRGSQPSGC